MIPARLLILPEKSSAFMETSGRGRVHRISISVVFGIPGSLQPSVKLEVAHCSEFLLGRTRPEPESAQFQRVWSMDGTTCPSKRVVCIAALQQIFNNADRRVLESMIREQGRTTKFSLFSQDLTSLNTTPQLTRFRGAKVCSKWLQERIDDPSIQSDYKCTVGLQVQK